jgi:hypothetical protein
METMRGKKEVRLKRKVMGVSRGSTWWVGRR